MLVVELVVIFLDPFHKIIDSSPIELMHQLHTVLVLVPRVSCKVVCALLNILGMELHLEGVSEVAHELQLLIALVDVLQLIGSSYDLLKLSTLFF